MCETGGNREEVNNSQEDNRPMCGLCGIHFTRNWNLKRHNDKFHPKCNKCLICKKPYHFVDNLIHHVHVHHKDAHDEFQPNQDNSFSCTYCGKKNFNVHFGNIQKNAMANTNFEIIE